MQREIKFRAKREGFDNWLYFDMSHHLSDDSGFPPDFLKYQLDVKTVGQFTGLHDKNENEIYEGDVFKSKKNSVGNIVVNPKLVYEDLRWVLESKDKCFEYLDYYEAETELEIIGNRHDNPELLKP